MENIAKLNIPGCVLYSRDTLTYPAWFAFSNNKQIHPYAEILSLNGEAFIGYQTDEILEKPLVGYFIEFDSSAKPSGFAIEISQNGVDYQEIYRKNSNIQNIESGSLNNFRDYQYFRYRFYDNFLSSSSSSSSSVSSSSSSSSVSSSSSSSSFINPFYYDGLAIYLGNENAVTDDNIAVSIQSPGPASFIQYETAGTYIDNIGGCGDGTCDDKISIPFNCANLESVSVTTFSDFQEILEGLEVEPVEDVFIKEVNIGDCYIEICSKCTGMLIVPEDIRMNSSTTSLGIWDTYFLRATNTQVGNPNAFSCSDSGAMNIDLQYSPSLLSNYLSGIESTDIGIKYISVQNNGCGNWGSYKVFGIKYLEYPVEYKSNIFLDFDYTLLAEGLYAGNAF